MNTINRDKRLDTSISAKIKQARQTDLAEYLLSMGVPLERSGHRYRHKNHNSLVFTKNAYYWNSRQDKGNAIDYLTRHMGMDFVAAVEALAGFIPPRQPENIHQVSFGELKIAKDYRRAIAYLHKSRGIDYSVIQRLIDRQYLMQEEKTNNIIFPMYDENNGFVGAELEGTLSKKRFKGVSAGSTYGYGFNVRYTDNGKFDYALFFESAVDLISFIDLKTRHQNKSLDRCILVSMAGLKENVVKHMTTAFGGFPVLCVDNDKAGAEFEQTIKAAGINYRVKRPDGAAKDWNEQLQATRKDKHIKNGGEADEKERQDGQNLH